MNAESGHRAPGRERELTQVMDALRAGGPTVVAVSGPPGSGKSYVTARVVAAAEAEGWRFTPYREGRGVRIGTGTTPEDLLRDVAEALDVPRPDGAPGRPLRSLARLLEREAGERPVGVVFDPYLPSRELVEGLRRQLLPAVRDAKRRVALVFVARRGLSDELSPDVSVHVSAPGSDSIERTLREATAEVVPPLGEAELAAYVAAARANPRLLTSLEAVLPLGSSGLGGRGGPTTPGSAAATANGA